MAWPLAGRPPEKTVSQKQHSVSLSNGFSLDNGSVEGQSHRPHTEGIMANDFNLHQAKKKLKALQAQHAADDNLPVSPQVHLEAQEQSNKFAGKSLSNILMVELYAGSARLSKACQQIGVPKPCRSEQFPLGIPGLEGLDKAGTEAANLLYKVTAVLVREVSAWGVVCTMRIRQAAFLEGSLYC